jgi:two-component system, OmpR family, response regulator
MVGTSRVRILVVEDNKRVSQVIEDALRGAGHAVEAAGTQAQALVALQTGSFDMAVVDVGLPDGSGLDVCRRVRADGLDLPILVLTARNSVHDRVHGLDAGADDYLGKPFSTAEVLARVRALARRGPHWTESIRAYGAIVIDRDRRLMTCDAQMVALTPREFEIVALLAWRNGRVVGKDEILEAAWGEVSESACASLEVLMVRIRRKLSAIGQPEAIRTVRQVGYAWQLQPSKRN